MVDKKVSVVFRAKDEFSGTLAKAERGFGDVKSAVLSFRGVVSGVALSALASSIFSTTKEFQSLNASLITVTGSQLEANAAFEMLQRFAAETPFQLQEVVGAYIKLKSLGLDPSIEALRSYGNTAAAMGKTLDQFVEAIADAAVGEFERLKEFGIKARSEGANVRFTFQGVTTTVKKDADDIEGYLRKLGQVQFAGGMERQMSTLAGATSNLADNWSSLMAAIGGKASKDAISLISSLSEAIDRLRRGLAPTNAEDLERIGSEIQHINEQIRQAQLTDSAWMYGGMNNLLDNRDRMIAQYRELIAANRQGFKSPETETPEPGGTTKPTALSAFEKQVLGRTLDEAWWTEAGDKIAGYQAQIRVKLAEETPPSLGFGNFDIDSHMAGVEEQRTANETRLELDRQFLETRQMLWWEAEEQMTAMQRLQQEMRYQAAQNITGGLMNLTNALYTFSGKKSKQLFDLNKVAGIADATVATYTGAAQALRSVPYPYNIAAAAMVVASGLSRVAAISSTSFGTGGGSPAAGGYGGGTPDSPIVTQPTGYGQQQQAGAQITIVIEGNVLGEDKWIEERLAPTIRELAGRNVDFGFERR